MSQDEDLLLDAPLTPDPDVEAEMGPGDVTAIADEDLKGSRLLLAKRAVEAADVGGIAGGAVELTCTFQPAPATRFTWARLVLRLTTPAGVKIVGLAPREVRENEPVRFALDRSGKVSLSYQGVGAEADEGTHKEFAIYSCIVQGTGEGTALARWDFNESPDRKAGLVPAQPLALTLPVTGHVTGTVSVNARCVGSGLGGKVERLRELVLGRPDERVYAVSFDIPAAQPRSGFARFLRLF